MIAVISFLIIILLSLIVVKIGSIALESTGLSLDIAQFQAQSAFSGIGFTTEEAESVVNNPIRRKIIRVLMLMGSAGLTTAIATLVLALIDSKETKLIFDKPVNSLFLNVSVILMALLIIFFLSRTKQFDKFIRWVLEKPLHLIKKKSMLYDYDTLLGLSKGYSVVQFEVPKHHWMVNKNIGQLETEKEGLMILGVSRKVHNTEEYIGLPSKEFRIHNKDKIMAYGKDNVISNFTKRLKGHKGKIQRKAAELLHKENELLKKLTEKSLANAVHKSSRKR